MQYKCTVCGYLYDDAKEKVPFSALPENWVCPLCGAPKSAFEPVQTKAQAPTIPNKVAIDTDMKKLSAGQLSALFSNLARGCEKQYKAEESSLFSEIADYFSRATAEKECSLDDLADLLSKDVEENYPSAKYGAEKNGDRGAGRICVWGEKVTRMLSGLVEKYRKEGEAMLSGKEIWVCTVCGFVYIGSDAPSLCPVCKVPSWKFEKIEGRA